MNRNSPNHVYNIAAKSDELNNVRFLESLDKVMNDDDGLHFASIFKRFASEEETRLKMFSL